MNWQWFVPIWGLRVMMQDHADNYANDYMDNKMLPITMYQIFVIMLPFSIVIKILN